MSKLSWIKNYDILKLAIFGSCSFRSPSERIYFFHSPGTGRTGTLIASDIAMRHFEEERRVDVPRTVYAVRRGRAGAVLTSEQYAYIYRVRKIKT